MFLYDDSKERSVTMQHCALLKRHMNGGYIERFREELLGAKSV